MSKELLVDQAMALAMRAYKKKSDQTGVIGTMLGATRTVRCYRDPNSAAKHPRLTGTEFLNVTVTGDIQFNSGAITNLGQIIATNINIPVDLSTGAAVLVIEGNGHRAQGSLSLTNDTAFNFSANMFAAAGIAFAPTATLQAYTYLDSGVGAPAPKKSREMVHSFKYWDWDDPLSPALVFTNYFTKRIENFSYQDREMALDNGDSSLYQTPADSRVGSHLFGGQVMFSDPTCTHDGLVVLQQVQIGMAHDSSWPNFPQMWAFSRKAHTLAIKACKITLHDMDDNLLHTFENHDGSAMNAEDLHSSNLGTGNRDGTHPLDPKVNIFQQLVWTNVMPRKSAFSDKLHNGMRHYRDSMSKNQSSMISVEPLITGGYGNNSLNGLGDFWYVDKWPLPDVYLQTTDPFLDDHMNAPGSSAYRSAWYQGWGYAPGMYGCHNWYTSPGGPRNDRCVIASMLVRFLDNPTGVRLQGNVSNFDMAYNWSLNYFNHSCHYTPSPSTMAHAVPNAEALNDEWAFANTYYGQYARDKMISLNGDQRDGQSNWNYDIDGNMVQNGYADDPLHDYGCRGVAAMVFTMPFIGLAAKFDLFKSMMLHQNPFSDVGSFTVRNMAWQWLQLTAMWKCASNHPNSITQKEIEDFAARKLESYFAQILKPAFIDQAQDARSRGIRCLGRNLEQRDGYYNDGGGRLGLYMGAVFQMMRQTGFWHAMRTHGGNCEQALLLVMKTYDNFVFGNMVEGHGAGGVYFGFGNGSDPMTIPESWAQWYAESGGGGSFIDPNNYNPNPDVSWNQFINYIYVRAEYFPEVAHPLMAQAVVQADYWENYVTTKVNAVSPTDGYALRNVDYGYRYPGVSPINGPKAGMLGTY